jgi:serine/threonine protein kinase
LASIHVVGFLHRDIRPENILVSEQGLTLIDFAYATRTNDHDAMRNELEELSLMIGKFDTAVDSPVQEL